MAENIKEQIENKVIDCIVAGAMGRMVVFKPDKLNVDLIVEKRGDYKTKTIGLNIYDGQPSESISIVPKENLYLMFVNFNKVTQDIADNFIVVPSNNMQNKLSMTKKSFVGFLIEKLGK